VSTRSIGRGKCPKCGEEGSLIVKSVGGKEYVYVKHGRTWHYVGPLDKVDVNMLLTEPTTTLPLNEGQEGVVTGGKVSGQPKPPSKVAAAVLGLVLIGLGAALTVLAVFSALLIPFWTIGSVRSAVGYMAGITVNGTETVYAITPLNSPVSVSVATRGCSFKVLVAPSSSLPHMVNASWLTSLSSLYLIKAENLSNLLPSFSGNYTSYNQVLEPEQALLVWPHKVSAIRATLNITVGEKAENVAQPSGNATFVIVTIIALKVIPRLLVAAALIVGGYLLHKWSKSG
jgi:hypothetical protein